MKTTSRKETVVVNVRMDPDTKKAIQEIALKERRPISAQIGLALDEWLDQRKNKK